MWIDADVFPLRRVGPLPLAAFAAVTDVPRTLDLDRSSYPALEEVESYCNAGVFVAERSATTELFKEWKKLAHAEQRSAFPDQGPLNVLLHRLLGGFTNLPLSWNWLISARPKPDDAILAHFAGVPFREKILDLLYAVSEGTHASADIRSAAARTRRPPRSCAVPAVVLQPQGKDVRIRFKQHGPGRAGT